MVPQSLFCSWPLFGPNSPSKFVGQAVTLTGRPKFNYSFGFLSQIDKCRLESIPSRHIGDRDQPCCQ
jgi:hypothetical protein